MIFRLTLLLALAAAVAALPTLDSPFLANPAHVTVGGLRINVLGAALGAGGNASETYDFYVDRLDPAIDRGLDNLSREELEALYDEALDVGADWKTADLAVLAPSVTLPLGPAAVGVGVYTQAAARGRFIDAGAGVPQIDLYGRADLAVPVVAGIDLSRTPAGLVLPFSLRLGASATYLQRRISAFDKPIDAIDPDAEKLYVFEGSAVRLAVGALAQNVGLPGIDLGAELSNVGGAIAYEFDRSYGDDNAADVPADIAALQARFDDRESAPVVRVGVAYRPLVNALPGIADAAVSLDYTSASTAAGGLDQSTQAGLRLGARARLAGVVALRAGLSQGMPTFGAGLVTKFARLEYATYGIEDGRLLGSAQRRNHVLQIRFGLY